jgi:hypothetical protein
MAIAHEQVHIQIYKMHGIESHIELFKYFPNIVTVPDREITTDDCNDVCQLSHSINEVVGYSLIWIAVIIIIGMLYIMIYLQKILDELRETKKQ